MMKNNSTKLLTRFFLVLLLTFTPALIADLDLNDEVKSLVMVDEDANGALALLEQLTGKSILRQQDLPQVKINYDSRGTLTRGEAILAVESSLAMNGIAITRINDKFYKAIPAVTITGQSPTLIKGSTLGLAPSQNYYSKVFQLRYLSPADARTVAQNVQTRSTASVIILEKSNAILMTDSLINLQRVETLLKELDKPLAVEDKLTFYPMKFVNATDVKKRLEELKKTEMKKYLASTVFEADETTNQLMVLAHPDNVKMIENLITNMDIDVAPLNRSKVFRIKHAQAKEVAALIKAVVQGKPKDDKTRPDARETAIDRLRTLLGNNNQQATPQNPANASQEFSKSLTVEPDERSNSVVAFGTPRDLELVDKLIAELDTVLPQVQIEVVIAQVTLTGDQVTGLSTFGISKNEPINIVTATNPTPPPPGNLRLENLAMLSSTNLTSPLSLAGSLKNFAFQSIFKIAQQDSNVEILSAPMIMTTHNKESEIKVVKDQPLIKEAVSNNENNGALRTSIEYIKDIGIVLNVTPLIGDDGVIQMQIIQTVKDLGPIVQLGNNQTANQILNREARSFVSVSDGDTIVLGGLKQRSDNYVKGRMFLFGYIPVLGDLLFSPKSKTTVVTELIIFIKPHVVKNDAGVVAQETAIAVDNLAYNTTVKNYLSTGDMSKECSTFFKEDYITSEKRKCKKEPEWR